MSVRYRSGFVLAALVAAAGLAWGRPGATASPTKAELEKKMTDMREREAGGSGRVVLSQREAKKLASDLDALWKEIETFGKGKLNGNLVRVIENRVEAWKDDDDYPLITLRVNRDHAQWIKNSSIDGERVLVSSSVKSEWRWRIIVSRESRSDKRMTDWIKEHAAWFLTRLKDPAKAEKAFQNRYNSSRLSLTAAMKQGSVPGYEVHHDIPLYVGTENGGRDRGAEDGRLSKGGGNYRLIPHSEHVSTHTKGGATYNKWGPPVLYVPRSDPGEEDPDTATGDLK